MVFWGQLDADGQSLLTPAPCWFAAMYLASLLIDRANDPPIIIRTNGKPLAMKFFERTMRRGKNTLRWLERAEEATSRPAIRVCATRHFSLLHRCAFAKSHVSALSGLLINRMSWEYDGIIDDLIAISMKRMIDEDKRKKEFTMTRRVSWRKSLR